MAKDTVEKILSCETKAADALAEAKEKAEKIIAEAKRQAAEILSSAETEAKAEVTGKLDAADKKSAEITADYEKKAEEEANRLSASALSKKDAALKAVTDLILA